MTILDRDTIGPSIRAEDFDASNPTQSEKSALIEQVRASLINGLSTLTFTTFEIRNKPAYRATERADQIAIRLLNTTLRRQLTLAPTDRDIAVRQISSILKEGVPHRVYKFDIKSFFESIDTKILSQNLLNDKRVSFTCATAVNRYFARLTQLGLSGVPRGLGLSATLAEYTMHNFDNYVSRLPHVYFYTRYVDDIIIITDDVVPQNVFSREIRRALPKPLSFNPEKFRFVDLPLNRSSTQTTIGSFDYLGYEFTITNATKTNNKLTRSVQISVAPKKLRRIKSRISQAFVRYFIDRKMDHLHKRLRLLSGNYNVRDAKTGQSRNVGLYCNYRRTNNFAPIQSLDSYLRSILAGNKSRLARQARAILSSRERRTLLTYNFSKSFKNRVFYNFKGSEISDLARCWRDA